MNRLLHLFRRRRFDSELTEEIHEHIRERTDELIRQGMSEDEAGYAARRYFGNATILREQSRNEWGFQTLEAIWQDLGYAARILRKSPAFTLVAVLCLALGISANTIIFTVVDHVLLRPLPYHAPERLVMVWTRNPSQGDEHGQVSAADFFDWRERAPVFDSISAYASWPMNLTHVAEPMRLNGELVSANFFATLGVTAELGRTFAPDDDQPDKNFVVVLSHRLWRQLGSSPQIVGATLTLNRSQATVMGVMPADFNFLGRDTDFWMPLSLSPQNRANREGRWLSVVARLAPNATLRDAESAMAVVANQLATAYPAIDKGLGVALVPLHDELVGNTRSMMLAVQGAVAFLLLITCANLANLLLARASGRSREIAVRAALGASRGRIVCQLIVESALLGALGGALGLTLAHFGVSAIRALGDGVIPRVAEIALDTHIMTYALLATGFTAILFGLLPALHAAQFDLRRHVYSGSRGTARGAEGQRSLLVSTELALACILLVGASLLAESLTHLYNTKPGFQTQNVLTMRITLPSSKYSNTGKQVAFFNQILERVARVPGIIAAGEVSDAPLSRNIMTPKFATEGGVSSAPLGLRFVSPGYLHAIGIPLLAGRDFSSSDTAANPQVALVNQTAAHRYWAGIDPIGKRLRLTEEERWLTVAGVVGDTRHMGLAADEGPVVYVPYAQKTWEFLGWTTLVIRTSGNPIQYVSAVRSQIAGIDKDQPVSEIATMEQSLSRSTAIPRLTTSVVSGVSALALIMAVIGVYGLVAYAIAQRVPEIGIRLALGASPGQLLWLLIRQGMLRVGAGIAAGLIGAWALTRWLASLLFGVQPHDLATFAAVGAMLIVVTLFALLLPARRVMRVDPVRALNVE